jgi:hypothetical protein
MTTIERSTTVSASKLALALSAAALLVSVLFVTPVGHAATKLVLGKNSVGTAQLKKNAVTSSKVKNGSLLAADFKAGQLPAGPKGDPGAQGPKGDPGAPGASATKLWAYLNWNGTLRRGSGIASTSKIGNGFYSVTFNQSIANCVGIASYMTEPGDGGYNMSNHFAVSRFNATQMYVSIWNSYTQTAPNIPFALIVVC